MARKNETANALQELKSALKNKQLERLYFFHGEETFLLNHYLGQIKKTENMYCIYRYNLIKYKLANHGEIPEQ